MLKTANNTYIVYEWCNGGNLFDRVAKSKLSEMDRKECLIAETNYMRQLLLAVKELHSCNIVYVNLHPRSIYLGRDNNLKISCFAHSRDLKDTENTNYRTDRFRFQDYLAPEIFEHHTFSTATDVYSLGLLFAFIRYGRIDNISIQQPIRIKNGEHLADMIQEMICKDPAERDDLDTVKSRLGLGTSTQRPLLAESKSSSKLTKADRKTSEDYGSPINKLRPDHSTTTLPPSN
jgi:serine/threonine protein kinase